MIRELCNKTFPAAAHVMECETSGEIFENRFWQVVCV